MASALPIGQPINGRRLHEAVVERLVGQIVGGLLPPGTLLPPEAQLAEQFGVSRMVLREAVRLLAAKGLVAVKHGSGTRVEPPERWDRLDPRILYEQVQISRDARVLDSIMEVRRLLEVELAGLAAERRTPTDLERLREALDRLTAAWRAHRTFGEWDLEFHDRVYLAADNPLLRTIVRPVTATLMDVKGLLAERRDDLLARSMRGHEAIFAAIRAGDSAAARAETRAHVMQFEAELRASRLFHPVPIAGAAAGTSER
jgi:GntR family transcriptional regulator, transcriptional repressor for pyruvate dehydrogenase complex